MRRRRRGSRADTAARDVAPTTIEVGVVTPRRKQERSCAGAVLGRASALASTPAARHLALGHDVGGAPALGDSRCAAGCENASIVEAVER